MNCILNYDEDIDFNKPLFFDVVLEKYVNDLNTQELKKILLTELKNNEKRTYELYLKKNYKNYLQDNNEFIFLDKLYQKIKDLITFYDYEYNDFNKVILNNKEKAKIEELYKNRTLQPQIDKILLNEKLAVYSDYQWVAKFYKKKLRRYSKVLQ